MLQQPIYSLFIRLIPEAFLIIYSICILSNSKVDFKKIFLASIIGGIFVYITRLLPIHFGVHTILSIMVDILLAFKINNIDIHKAIAGGMISIILIFVSEFIIFAFYINILHIPSELLSEQSLIAIIYSIPSLLIFYILVRLIVYIRNKVKGDKHEQC